MQLHYSLIVTVLCYDYAMAELCYDYDCYAMAVLCYDNDCYAMAMQTQHLNNTLGPPEYRQITIVPSYIQGRMPD